MYVVFFVNLLFAKCSSATGGTDIDTMDTLPMDLGFAAEQEPIIKNIYTSALVNGAPLASRSKFARMMLQLY